MKLRNALVMIFIFVLLIGVTVVFAQDEMMTYTVSMGGTDDLGAFFVDSEGMTLYIFTNDTPGVSVCADQCAENWPPLLVGEDERPTLADGIPGILGVITRDDGGRQVEYNGMPLYYFAQDAAPGDTTGQGRGDVWWVATTPDVSLGGNADVGDFLVGADGLTLYWFMNDTDGMSACYDQCADNWPPLLVDSADALTVQPGLIGEFGTTERTDGTIQVTYNNMPLYYFTPDEAPGDAMGQGRGDVWWVGKPTTVNVGGNDELGDFIVGPNGMTLYLFTNDEDGMSACYEGCAAAWPPLLVAEGETPTAGDGVMGELGTTMRDDGGLQVTLNGIPLYYWQNDYLPGDATGQGFRDVWYVLTPEGEGVGMGM